MTKVAIRYPKETQMKWYTKRYLDDHKIEREKVTLIAEVPEALFPKLYKYGNTIIPLESHYNLYKTACHTLIKLFDTWTDNPTLEHLREILDLLDLTPIDKVKELIKDEQMEREVK